MRQHYGKQVGSVGIHLTIVRLVCAEMVSVWINGKYRNSRPECNSNPKMSLMVLVHLVHSNIDGLYTQPWGTGLGRDNVCR